MKTSPVTLDDLWRSVISVPPLCRDETGQLSKDQNARLVSYLSAGGVTTFLWGGNANLYNMPVSEYPSFLDLIVEVSQPDSWMIPSIGADYGKALDQIDILKERDFPTAMVLPLASPVTSSGVATGLRRLAERYGRPIVAYVKSETYITPSDLASVAADGVISFIKYANVRENPENDPYLETLVDIVDPKIIVSGIGERPVLSHLGKFGLTGFTSGSVCLAPRASTQILQLLKDSDFPGAGELREHFIPLEDLRDGHSPITILHHAIGAAGIAETGPLAPFLSNIEDAALMEKIRTAAVNLAAYDAKLEVAN